MQSDSAPLLPNEKLFSVSTKTLTDLVSICAYITFSICLICVNKTLMSSNVFPYGMILTFCHMSFSACFSWTLLYFKPEVFEKFYLVKNAPRQYLYRLVPLGVAFSMCVILQNKALLYCSIPFTQMVKEMNLVFVYALALMLGTDTLGKQTLWLAVVMVGCVMAIHGEMHFVALGAILQVSGTMCDAFKITIQNAVLSPHLGMSLDAMTMVLCMTPLCAVGIAGFMKVEWDGLVLSRLAEAKYGVLLSCCLAICLNISAAVLIKRVNGIGYVLASQVKDILIVAVPVMAMGQTLPAQQAFGFAITIVGIGFYSTVKLEAKAEEARQVSFRQAQAEADARVDSAA